MDTMVGNNSFVVSKELASRIETLNELVGRIDPNLLYYLTNLVTAPLQGDRLHSPQVRRAQKPELSRKDLQYA